MEGTERENVEARIRCLRNIQVLLDAAVLEMQQYSNVINGMRSQSVSSTSVTATNVTTTTSTASTTVTSSASATIVTPTEATGAKPKVKTSETVMSEEEKIIEKMDKEEDESKNESKDDKEQDELRRRRLAKFEFA